MMQFKVPFDGCGLSETQTSPVRTILALFKQEAESFANVPLGERAKTSGMCVRCSTFVDGVSTFHIAGRLEMEVANQRGPAGVHPALTLECIHASRHRTARSREGAVSAAGWTPHLPRCGTPMSTVALPMQVYTPISGERHTSREKN